MTFVQLNIPAADVEQLLVSLILDNRIAGRLDQVGPPLATVPPPPPPPQGRPAGCYGPALHSWESVCSVCLRNGRMGITAT